MKSGDDKITLVYYVIFLMCFFKIALDIYVCHMQRESATYIRLEADTADP